jgi:hypothetical protein
MIAEGLYKARGTSLSVGKSGTKGTLGATVVFSITQDGPQKGQLIDWTGWLTEAAKGRTGESLVLCGYDGTDPATIGKNEVLLVVAHEDYTPDATATNPNPVAQKRAKVQWVNDPNRGGAGMVPLDAAEQAQVMQDLRGLVFAKREEMAKKAAASGDGTSFNFGANGQQGAPPPAQQQPPPTAAKAPPRF